jgi:putative colanic acid biosynthesis acetyltransferase WcaF
MTSFWSNSMTQTKIDLSTYDNTWYQPGSKVKRLFWYFFNSLILKNGWLPFSSLRIWGLKIFGASIGNNVVIKPGVSVKYPWKLHIGNNCWIGENVWIDNLDEVTLEDNVCISQGALLLCGNHNYKSKAFDLMIAPILIKEGAWIGANCSIAPGIVLESHAVLTMGSTATTHLEAYGIYTGNPAVKVKLRQLYKI